MKSVSRIVVSSVLGLGLLVFVGCDSNDKLASEGQQGSTTVAPDAPKAEDYTKMGPPKKALGAAQYGKSGASYGAAQKAMR